MYISLPTFFIAAAVAHGVVAIPAIPYQSDRFASPESRSNVDQFNKRSVKSVIFKGLIPWAIAGTVVGGHVLGSKYDEWRQLKYQRERQGEEKGNVDEDEDERDKSTEQDRGAYEDEEDDD